MRAVVVYESMYGNTHLVAEAIAEGFGGADRARAVPVSDADASMLAGADLIVVGGPTHAHSMSRDSTRKNAIEMADKPDSDLTVDPDAAGPGVRDWLEQHDGAGLRAAAFDTRIDMSAAITGRASKGIARKLRHHGFHVIDEPTSFLVAKDNHLEPGELDRAHAWGQALASQLTATDDTHRVS